MGCFLYSGPNRLFTANSRAGSIADAKAGQGTPLGAKPLACVPSPASHFAEFSVAPRYKNTLSSGFMRGGEVFGVAVLVFLFSDL